VEEFIIKFINTQIGKLINKICTISFYEINTHTHIHIYCPSSFPTKPSKSAQAKEVHTTRK